MITLNSIELLLRSESLFESLITAKVHFKLKINNVHSYESPEIPIKSRFAKWKSFDMNTKIKMPDATSKNYEIQMAFYKGYTLVGRAKSQIMLGHNRKDCLDVVDDSFIPVGKCTYSIEWASGTQQNQYNYLPNVYANEILKWNQKPEKQYAKFNPNLPPPNLPQKLQRQKPKKKEGLLDSMIGCFGCTGKINKPMDTKLAIIPIQIYEEQLEYAPPSTLDAYPLQYYSRRFPARHAVSH